MMISPSVRASLCVSLAAMMVSIGLAPRAAHAQTQKKARPAAASKATAKKAPIKKANEKAVVLAPAAADAEQIAAAEWVYYGVHDCEFNQKVEIAINSKYPAYVDVQYLKTLYLMKPVLSSTGAIRLEDVKGQTVMIQIANKSMLLDVKAGHRLVDECVGKRQRELMEAARLQREQQTGAMPVAEPLLRADPVARSASATGSAVPPSPSASASMAAAPASLPASAPLPEAPASAAVPGPVQP